jgi:hypothetical protein
MALPYTVGEMFTAIKRRLKQKLASCFCLDADVEVHIIFDLRPRDFPNAATKLKRGVTSDHDRGEDYGRRRMLKDRGLYFTIQDDPLHLNVILGGSVYPRAAQ